MIGPGLVPLPVIAPLPGLAPLSVVGVNLILLSTALVPPVIGVYLMLFSPVFVSFAP